MEYHDVYMQTITGILCQMNSTILLQSGNSRTSDQGQDTKIKCIHRINSPDNKKKIWKRQNS